MKIFAQKDIISRKLQVPMKIMHKMVFGAEDNPPFVSYSCYMPLASILLSHIGVCRTSLLRLSSHYISIHLLDRYRVYMELELTDWNESGSFDLYLKSLRYLPPCQDRAVWKL
jgi:hypothetical protein